MVIIDEQNKQRPAPPPYVGRSMGPPPFQHGRRPAVTIDDLPPHILLQIVQSISPPELTYKEHRNGLYWMCRSLRLVSRGFYIGCMHVLRSTYLPLYAQNLKPYFSSDPFPLSAPSPLSATSNALQSVQRETVVFDLFLALKIKEDVRADESSLHLDLDSFKDIFELMQPRSRVEDLIRHYGLQQNVVTLAATSSRYVPFQSISVSFSTKKVGLLVTDSKGRKKLLCEVTRYERDEPLEICAKRLVKELAKILQRTVSR